MSGTANRIGYIDALRGFTMILVVFQHIYLPNFTPLCVLLITLRMPLFFFISGYISYRANQEWSTERCRDLVVDKLRRLIIPILVVGAIYSLIVGVKLEWFVHDPYKSGYWFTLSLFEMLLFYYVVRLVAARFKSVSEGRLISGIFICATLVYLLLFYELEYSYEDLTSISKTVEFIPFFALGLLLGHYRERFNRWVDSGYMWGVWGCFAAIVTIIFVNHERLAELHFFDNLVLTNNSSYEATVLRYAVRMVVSIIGLLSVYGVFRHLSHLFEHNRRFKPMQYVGRHTLEVYLFHYILLINFTPMLRPYIVDDPNVLVQIVVGFVVAAIIAAGALLIGYILRRVPYVDYYLLAGRKPR